VAVRRFPRWRAGFGVVLIVADDPLARAVYAELFALRGYDVATACSAREGVRRLARDRGIAVAVLAVASGAMQLRRRLHAVRPWLRVHVTGLLPLGGDAMTPQPGQMVH
jgi:CheY-like chemotaxis protein